MLSKLHMEKLIVFFRLSEVDVSHSNDAVLWNLISIRNRDRQSKTGRGNGRNFHEHGTAFNGRGRFRKICGQTGVSFFSSSFVLLFDGLIDFGAMKYLYLMWFHIVLKIMINWNRSWTYITIYIDLFERPLTKFSAGKTDNKRNGKYLGRHGGH